MKIKQLRLKNFGSFNNNLDFDLDDNLVIFSGDNYSGKTTIARAIYFSVCQKVLTSGLKLKDLATTGKKSATVGLVYENHNQTCRTYRSTKGDVRNEVWNDHDWEIRDTKDSNIPGLNADQWRIGCFLNEEELGEFLGKTPSNRRDLLNQILGVEQLLQAQKTFIEARRISKRKTKSAISQQTGLRLDEFEDCEAELLECREQIVTLEQKLKQPENVDTKQSLHEEWTRQMHSVEGRLEKIAEKWDSLLAGFEDPEEIRLTLSKITDRLVDRDKHVEQLDAIKEKRILFSSESKRMEKELSEVSGLEGKKLCPTCRQTISSVHISNLETTFSNQIEEIRNSLSQIKEDERIADETMNLFDELSAREANLANRLAQIQNMETDKIDLLKERDLLGKKLSSSPASDGFKEDPIDVHQKLEQAHKDLSILEKQHALYIENQKRIDAANRAAQTATRNQLICEWVADAMNGTVEQIMGVTLANAEEDVLSCLKDFCIFQDTVLSIALEKSKLMPSMHERPFHALSGSEKIILYLGIKIALSRLMPGADFLVLDNPTAHLDRVHQSLMAEYLMSLIPEKQVIILTNESDFARQFSDGKKIQI
jgi:recombinational DNA repair ATPase RecF